MKQFIVDRHTTPNTPTLEQVPTEKIPIYENRAAVTADLANLSVGQIVATKDTGDELAQPVDVVEEDNMHAVTSNAVAEAIGDKILAIKFSATVQNSFFDIDISPYNFTDYKPLTIGLKYSSGSVNATCYQYSFQLFDDTKVHCYLRQGTSIVPDNTSAKGYLLILKSSEAY